MENLEIAVKNQLRASLWTWILVSMFGKEVRFGNEKLDVKCLKWRGDLYFVEVTPRLQRRMSVGYGQEVVELPYILKELP